MKDLRVDSHHQREIGIPAGNVLGRVTQRCRSAKFLESDEIRMIASQFAKQVGLGLKAIVRAIVNHRGQSLRSLQRQGKVSTLRRHRDPSGKDPGNQHQTGRAHFLGVSGMFRSQPRILGSRSNDDRDSRFHQTTNSLLSLLIRQQRPVPHGTAIHNRAHANVDQFASFANERVIVG